MADIVLYDRSGAAVTYTDIETITTDSPEDGKQEVFTHGQLLDAQNIELSLAEGDQSLNIPDGYLIKEATIKKPDTLIAANIKKDVNIAGVVGEMIGDGVEKTVDLNMTDGDQIIDHEDDKLLTKVIVKKPDTLLPANIRSGISIGGVEGTITTPKLYTPTATVTSYDMYDNIVVTNPVSNGAFATSLNCYLDDTLVTSKEAPKPGETITIADTSLYNGTDGKFKIGMEFVSDNFTPSDRYERDVDMVKVEITPDEINDGYSYPAIHKGSTYTGRLIIKDGFGNDPKLYLPPKISVTIDGNETFDYTWDNDCGLTSLCKTATNTILPDLVVNRVGSLIVPNVNGSLILNIPRTTNNPQLSPPAITYDNDGLIFTPSNYAEGMSVFVDDKETYTFSGATYVGSLIANTFSSSSTPSHVYGTGVTVWRSESANKYAIYRLTFSCPEAASIVFRCVNYHENSDGAVSSSVVQNNYAVIGNINSELSQTYLITSDSIFKSFSSTKVNTNVQEVTMEFPQGESFIDFKIRLGVAEPTSYSSGFFILPYQGKLPIKHIKLNDYDKHTISAKVNAEDFLDSELVSIEYQFKPSCQLNNCKLTIQNLLPIVNNIEVYVDAELVDTFGCNGSDTMVIDMTQYSQYDGKHDVIIRAIGTNVSCFSNLTNGYISHVPIYGVSGMYQSDPLLTRTDDAIGMTYSINTDGTVQSDFNNVFPWSEAKIVKDSNGNKFLQMPEMYFRVGTDDNYRITDIAVSPEKGEAKNWYKVEPFCVGCYSANYNGNTKLTSKSGITNSSGATITNLRKYARNNGDGYQINDLYHQTILQFLWWIEWATKNTPSIMTGCYNGTGTTGGSGTITSGLTDTIKTPSGYESTRKRMRWHYIEDFVGGLTIYLDGAYMRPTNYQNYVTDNPAYFGESSANKKTLAYKNPSASSFCVKAYGWDPNNPFLCLPCEDITDSTYSSYFCSQASGYGSNIVLACGTNYYWTGSGIGGSNNGFVLRCASSSSAYTNYGARLMYHGTLE